MQTIDVTCPACVFCGKYERIKVPFEGYVKWQHGELIQKALPELTSDQRELLMNGTHAECWSAYMGDDDE